VDIHGNARRRLAVCSNQRSYLVERKLATRGENGSTITSGRGVKKVIWKPGRLPKEYFAELVAPATCSQTPVPSTKSWFRWNLKTGGRPARGRGPFDHLFPPFGSLRVRSVPVMVGFVFPRKSRHRSRSIVRNPGSGRLPGAKLNALMATHIVGRVP